MLRQETPGTLDEVKAAVEEYRGSGYQLGITALYVLLCPVLMLRGLYDEALDLVERGLVVVRNNSETIFEAELLRLKARTLLQMSGANADDRSQALLHQALRTAEKQGARSLQLRVVRDLADLWIREGKPDTAREMLSRICSSFNEGAETPDLKGARRLLAEL